jgi:hypothetical protein
MEGSIKKRKKELPQRNLPPLPKGHAPTGKKPEHDTILSA